MKKNDLAIAVVVAVVVTLVAYFVLNGILGDPDRASETVEYIAPITSDLSRPNPEVFNAEAINPTVEVIIGE
jgi:hypothetical protein